MYDSIVSWSFLWPDLVLKHVRIFVTLNLLQSRGTNSWKAASPKYMSRYSGGSGRRQTGTDLGDGPLFRGNGVLAFALAGCPRVTRRGELAATRSALVRGRIAGVFKWPGSRFLALDFGGGLRVHLTGIVVLRSDGRSTSLAGSLSDERTTRSSVCLLGS